MKRFIGGDKRKRQTVQTRDEVILGFVARKKEKEKKEIYRV
jgi:hypothetical protein